MPICLECGAHYKLLNSHITRTHKITTTEYRVRHGDDVPFSDEEVKALQRANGFSPWSATDLIERGMSKDDVTEHLREKRASTFGSHTSVRSIEYWKQKGYSDNDAAKEVRRVQSRGEEFFVKRYGDHGIDLHHAYRESIGASNSTDSLLNRGLTKEEIRLIHDNLSVPSLMLKYNLSEPDAIALRSERLVNHATHLSLMYWIACGYSMDDAEKKISSLQRRDLNFFVCRYGEVDGMDRYCDFIHKTTSHSVGKFASKESSNFFAPLIEYCDIRGIVVEKEWYVSVDGKSYYVDLVLPQYGLIFEYDGEAFHADPFVIDETWVSAKGNIGYWESIEYDSAKTAALESIGFKVIRIHSKYKNEFDLINILEERMKNATC